MKLSAGCDISLQVKSTTHLVLLLCPQSGYAQTVLNSGVALQSPILWQGASDRFGNFLQRTTVEPGPVTIHAKYEVEVADQIDVAPGAPYTLVQNVPDNALDYLLPSRYCQGDMLHDLACEVTKGIQAGYDQVEAIRQWLFTNLKYEYGASNASTSAVETARNKKGVCRDFAHLGIALCRSLRIPARFVSGNLLGLEPMDLHAWFEAFVGGRWYTFDATQKQPKGNRIVLGYGRDAADVAQISEYGSIELKGQKVWVNAA